MAVDLITFILKVRISEAEWNVGVPVSLHNITSLNVAQFHHYFHFTTFRLGEKELVEFLTEEILAEKKAQKVQTIPTELNGFKVKLDAAEVELVKQNGSEK